MAGKKGVKIEKEGPWKGQESVFVQGENALWIFHKAGGGFASLIDGEGNDWISYQPGNGPHGPYRGIPNLVFPESLFHPGSTGCESAILEDRPDRAAIHSRTSDGQWETRWDIFPDHARLTVLKAAHPYWFLYEGTPGGRFEPEASLAHRSDGVSASLAERWQKLLPHPAWVAFTNADRRRQILLLRHEPDGEGDLYWPMEGAMTVFGFGRNDDARQPRGTLTQVPAVYTVALLEGGRGEGAKKEAARFLTAPLPA